jgi:hypothetical protein
MNYKDMPAVNFWNALMAAKFDLVVEILDSEECTLKEMEQRVKLTGMPLGGEYASAVVPLAQYLIDSLKQMTFKGI